MTRTVLENLTRSLGFDVVRVARVRPTPHADALDGWLATGAHADMHWMVPTREVRRDPRHRWPWVRSAIVLGVLHAHQRPPDPGGRTGLVARYAWGRDYHNVVGKRLRKLKRHLREAGLRSWGGVDTAPILERPWANAAGLGFTGKHSLQILVGSTSWMVLGVLFVDADLQPDPPVAGEHCGRCVRCLSACPTDAFPRPYVVDSRRCISYWTIEARGLPPRELRPKFGRWAFGCDVCQEVCPHNHHPDPCLHEAFAPRHAWLDLDWVLATPDEALLNAFTGTPLRRPGAVGLKRNALWVLANLGDDGAVDGIRRHAMGHANPVVRAAAAYALGRLGAPQGPVDHDAMVRAEQIAAPASRGHAR